MIQQFKKMIHDEGWSRVHEMRFERSSRRPDDMVPLVNILQKGLMVKY